MSSLNTGIICGMNVGFKSILNEQSAWIFNNGLKFSSPFSSDSKSTVYQIANVRGIKI